MIAPLEGCLKTTLTDITSSGRSNKQTVLLESGEISVLLRLFDRELPKENVILTIAVELPV